MERDAAKGPTEGRQLPPGDETSRLPRSVPQAPASGHSPRANWVERADGDATAGPRHPAQLANCDQRVGDEVAEGDGHGHVEYGVAEREALRVGEEQRSPDTTGGDGQRGGVEVRSGDRLGALFHGGGEPVGPASHIEDAPAAEEADSPVKSGAFDIKGVAAHAD